LAISFEQVLIDVWRQVLVENADMVVLGTEYYHVRQTPKSHLRQVDFVFEGSKIRGLEQNPATKSRWAQLARSGKNSDAIPGKRALYRECGRWKGHDVWRREKGTSFNLLTLAPLANSPSPLEMHSAMRLILVSVVVSVGSTIRCGRLRAIARSILMEAA
jgi:hypothetical protein